MRNIRAPCGVGVHVRAGFSVTSHVSDCTLPPFEGPSRSASGGGRALVCLTAAVNSMTLNPSYSYHMYAIEEIFVPAHMYASVKNSKLY